MPLNMSLDLLVFLQKPQKRSQELRKFLLPLLEERLKDIQPHVMNSYMRKVINLEDTTPGQDVLSVL